jgi:serine/threonine protein kinase
MAYKAINEMFKEIVKGFMSLHAQGVVHRDIKPENILIKGGKPKIADFGLSKLADKDGMFVSRVGTELFMAPELRLHKPYSSRADVYSLGILLLSMYQPKAASSFHAHSKSTPDPAPFLKQHQFPLRPLLQSMLHPDPCKRMAWQELY